MLISHQKNGGWRLLASTLVRRFFFSFLLTALMQLGKDLAEFVRDSPVIVSR